MRNRSIACFLSLTLVFNSFAPCLAFAVGEGETETEQALTEVTPSDIEQEARQTADSLWREYMEAHPEETGETSLSPAETAVIDDELLEPQDTILETAEEILYGIRKFTSTINDTVEGIFTAAYTIVQAFVSYHGEDSGDYSYGSLAYFIKWGYFTTLNIAADLESVMTYVKDMRNGSFYTVTLGDKTTTYSVAQLLYKFLSYAPDTYPYGVAELVYYVTQNLEIKGEDGKIVSAAELLSQLVELSSYESPDGWDFGIAEALYYVVKNTDSMNESLTSVNTVITGVRDRLQYKSGSTTYYAGSMLYYIWQNLRYTASDGTQYGTAELLYRVHRSLRFYNPDGSYVGLADLLHEGNEALHDVLGLFENVLKYQKSSDDSLYLLVTASGDVIDKLSEGNEALHDLLGLFEDLFKYLRSSDDSLSKIVNRLQYTPNGSTTTYHASSMIYYIWQNLRYTTDTGVTYNAGSLLYYIWQCLRYLDNSDILHTSGSLLHSINKKFDELIKAVEGIDSGVVVLDPSKYAHDNSLFYDELVGSLDTAALVSKLDELSALLEKAFPFCLVFGFVAIIELLVAPADAPSFEFPIPTGVIGEDGLVYYPYIVDLEVFDPVAGVFRGMITIVYIIGLIRLTNTFVFKGGSE